MSIEGFKTNSVAINISRDMALMYGLVEPTEEERREMDATHREYERRRKVAAMVIPAAIERLDELTDPASRAVLDHHAREESFGRWVCAGCDQGCSCDTAEWPCSTVHVIARLHHIDTTDADLFDRPKDGSLDRKV